MTALLSVLWPVTIIIVVALIIYWIVQRFSPDALITKIFTAIIFVVTLWLLLQKLLPLLH